MPFIPPHKTAALRRRYAEPHRFYHTQAHIDALLALAELHRDEISDSLAVHFAIWYHDALYDPMASDNEEESARLLLSDMAGHADTALLLKAAAFIRATATHTVPPELTGGDASDCRIFLDMDLAILGADDAAFAAFETAIAREYSCYAADKYRAGRAGVLSRFLARKRIYFTESFQEALESRARVNLAVAIRALGENRV